MKATWNGNELADSDHTKVGGTYFPPGSVNWEAHTPSDTTTRCFWKGKASHFDAHAGDHVNQTRPGPTRTVAPGPPGRRPRRRTVSRHPQDHPQGMAPPQPPGRRHRTFVGA